MGMWMPWDLKIKKTGRVEYLEEELNQLMENKIKMKQMLNKNLIKEY